MTNLEEFFDFYTHFKTPEQLPVNTDLFFFREGDIPMWENSPEGGIWIAKLNVKDDDINLMWETILMAMVGEQFEDPSVIIGASLSLRNSSERLI